MNALQKRKNITSYLLALAGFAVAVFADQLTKYLAVLFLKNAQPFTVIDGVFEFHYLENRGAAFGLMQNRQFVFVIGAAAIFIIFAYLYGKLPHEKKYYPLRICAVLLCAGAVGNMIDRLRLNYVIDFLYFKLIDFPIFNVADCYVVISCISFVLLISFYYRDDSDFDFLKSGKKNGTEDESKKEN